MKKNILALVFFIGIVFCIFGQNVRGFTHVVENNRVTITGHSLPVPATLVIPASINGLPVTTIRNAAFRNHGITSVTIPDSVITIGDWAFSLNRLANVTIPNSVTTIGRSAFADNQLTNITIPNSITSISNGVFAGNRLINVIIPNSVTSIGADAFRNNPLTNITIPDSVTSVGVSAFADDNTFLPPPLPPALIETLERRFGWMIFVPAQ
jgi:hypothetical protein